VAYGIAEFWASRVTWNVSADQYQLLNIMGPDEYNWPVNNSAYCNVVAQKSLQFAIQAAQLLGNSYPSVWDDIVNKLDIPLDTERQIHPEYDGYINQTVKQADTVLLAYPFGLSMPANVRQNDLAFYEAVTDQGGPAMTWAMFALGWLDQGNDTKAADLFPLTYANNVNEPFQVWSEVVHGGGAANFVTGAGGFLQLLINGYGGARVNAQIEYLALAPSSPPPGVTSMTVWGLKYQCLTLDVSTTADQFVVSNRAVVSAIAAITDGQGNTTMLHPGDQLTFGWTSRPLQIKCIGTIEADRLRE